MSDSLEQAHIRVAFDLLALNPAMFADDGTSRVYDAALPEPTPDPPYVLIYGSAPFPKDGIGTSLAGLQVTIRTVWICHCVGLTALAARNVGSQVRSSLLNARPTIGGRNCQLIKQDDAQPVGRDDSTNRAVFDEVLIFSFTSTG